MSVRSTHIERFEAEYNLPAGISDPDEAQRRLDGIIAAEIERVWDEELSLRDDGEVIYFIEHVHVDLSVDMARMDDRAMARTWARAIQQEIARAIARNEPGIIIFQNRADYLASFLHDLLHGSAWDRWYYREFTAQASHTVSSAIVDVLTADADIGRDAMILMGTRGGLDLLLATLSDDEVDIVVERCLLPVSPRLRLPRMLPAWARALRGVLAERTRSIGTWGRDLARIYARLLGRNPELGPDVNLARFIGDLLLLRDQLLERSTGRRMLSLLDRDMFEDAVQALRGDGTNGIGTRGDQSVFLRQIEEVLRDLTRETSAQETAALLRDLAVEQVAVTRRIVTPFGGLFLLVPVMLETGLHRVLAEVESHESERESGDAALLFWMVLAQCLGAEHGARALRDDAMRFLAGCTERITREVINRYCNLESASTIATRLLSQSNTLRLSDAVRIAASTTTAQQPEAYLLSDGNEPLISYRPLDDALAELSTVIMRGFAARLGAFSASSPAYLRRNFLLSHAEVEVAEGSILVRFLSSPLQMVLQMAGFGSLRVVIPWLGDRELSFTFES